jgi:hypothetical protein
MYAVDPAVHTAASSGPATWIADDDEGEASCSSATSQALVSHEYRPLLPAALCATAVGWPPEPAAK